MHFIDVLNERSQAWRATWLKPVCRLLTALHITPNRLTFLRFLAGPAFFVYFPVYPRKMTLLLLVAAALDFVDGALARFQRVESDRGKFWDVLVDHTNYAFAILTMLMTQAFNTAGLAYHLLIMPVAYLLSTIKHSEKTKSDWIIHPYYTIVYYKPLALIALVLYVVWGYDTIDTTLLVLNIGMTIQAVWDATVLAHRWNEA